jgi:hypothetical protein
MTIPTLPAVQHCNSLMKAAVQAAQQSIFEATEKPLAPIGMNIPMMKSQDWG